MVFKHWHTNSKSTVISVQGTAAPPLKDVSGRLEIGYSGEDIIRVRDQAVINSEFELDVEFAPFNLGFLTKTLQ